jgi:hypothetical protein
MHRISTGCTRVIAFGALVALVCALSLLSRGQTELQALFEPPFPQ